MEKTIKEVKERAEELKKAILQLISDFEVTNPEVNVRVTTSRSYSASETSFSHNVDVDLSIK
jgi:hypothetical protein|nr:MAG TPA: hypothetical protein [Crassvirales sp.]